MQVSQTQVPAARERICRFQWRCCEEGYIQQLIWEIFA